MSDPAHLAPPEDAFRPHAYDGIREYDKRLPNWWLWTLYLTIIFSVVYWFYYFTTGVGPDDRTTINREMQRIEDAKLASVGSLNDEVLWKMSRNPVSVDAGKATFTTTCVICHLASLRGKAESPAAVGASLIGTKWIYGGRPVELVGVVFSDADRDELLATVEESLDRLSRLVENLLDMPAWGPVLGTRRITEVVAYVLSHHEPGEPVEIVASPAPGVK